MTTPDNHDEQRMAEFHRLTEVERVDAARRLAAHGLSDGDVARACAVSVEMARRWIGPRGPQR